MVVVNEDLGVSGGATANIHGPNFDDDSTGNRKF